MTVISQDDHLTAGALVHLRRTSLIKRHRVILDTMNVISQVDHLIHVAGA